MIAPAMNTRPQETLSYRDLARQQAQISRQVSLAALPRLNSLVMELAADEKGAAALEALEQIGQAGFEVELQFEVDGRGFSRVEGTLSGPVLLSCNRCAEQLVHPLELSFACVIVETEAIAEALVEENRRRHGEPSLTEDVLVANGSEVTMAQIVEDEILLNLPERLCVSDPCERAPVLAYPAAEAAKEFDQASGGGAGQQQSPAEEDENPFSVLAELKIGGTQVEDK